jgi:hypothetical protein
MVLVLDLTHVNVLLIILVLYVLFLTALVFLPVVQWFAVDKELVLLPTNVIAMPTTPLRIAQLLFASVLPEITPLFAVAMVLV